MVLKFGFEVQNDGLSTFVQNPVVCRHFQITILGFWSYGTTRALTLRFGGVRRQTLYLGTPTSSILSIFEVFMIPRLFWKIFFRGSKYFALFSKKVPPPELNFAEKISDRDFSKLRQKFSKRLNLRKVFWLKFVWFKYELLTPTD